MAELDIAEFLRPGDTVLIGQAAAEPPVLVREFIAAAHAIDGLTAFCGYTLSDLWEGVSPGQPHIKAYVAHGSVRKLSAKGLVEINANMPRTRASRRLHQSRVTASVTSSDALADTRARPPTQTERAVARNVAAFVPSGATIQLGVSALADAVAAELHDRRRLRVRGALAGDWLADLAEAGALDDSPGSCVVGMALGAKRLYRLLSDSALVRMAPIDEQLAQAAMAECHPYVAVNSAIEVDLHGQVSSEVAAGRYVGAVGGQVDFFRAARRARSGLAIVALAATDAAGTTSRIVPAVTGPVTTPQSDIDLVITEFGAADLRGTSYRERAGRLIEIAAPRHRAALRSGLPSWL